jgi:hypothetical protein
VVQGRQLTADDLAALARPGAVSPTIETLTLIIPGPDDLHEDAAALRLAAAVAGPGLTLPVRTRAGSTCWRLRLGSSTSGRASWSCSTGWTRWRSSPRSTDRSSRPAS